MTSIMDVPWTSAEKLKKSLALTPLPTHGLQGKIFLAKSTISREERREDIEYESVEDVGVDLSYCSRNSHLFVDGG